MGSLNSVSLASTRLMESRAQIKNSVLNPNSMQDPKIKKGRKSKASEDKLEEIGIPKRDPNWTEEEVKLLLTSLAENKKEAFLNGNTQKVQQIKMKAWERVSSKFPKRTLEKIKSKFESLKSTSRKRRADVKSALSQTGGGPEPDLKMLDTDQLITYISGPASLDGIPGCSHLDTSGKSDLAMEEGKDENQPLVTDIIREEVQTKLQTEVQKQVKLLWSQKYEQETVTKIVTEKPKIKVKDDLVKKEHSEPEIITISDEDEDEELPEIPDTETRPVKKFKLEVEEATTPSSSSTPDVEITSIGSQVVVTNLMKVLRQQSSLIEDLLKTK